MSQISPPLRILLAGSILFLAAWFVLLRPGGAEVEPAAVVPGQAASAPGQAVDSAEQAAGAASQSAQQSAGEAPGATTAAPPATAAQAAQAEAVPAVKGKAALVEAGMPSDVAARVDKKVIALAFVNRDAADDRRVARAMHKVFPHRGKVWTKTTDIRHVSKYAAITRGADVQQSPTVVVVDKHRNVATLVGYSDAVSINQSVIDALLVDGRPVDDSPYLQKLEGVCGDVNNRLQNLPNPRNLKQFRAYVADVARIVENAYPRLRSAKAPKRYRDVKRDLVYVLDADERLVANFKTLVDNGQSPAAAWDRTAALEQARELRKRVNRLDLRLAGLGLDDCR